MQYASFTGLMRTLLFIFVFYYIGKFLFKYIVPFFLANYVKNQTNTQQTYQENKEGTTTIDKVPDQNNKNDRGVGEYVDYEEVD